MLGEGGVGRWVWWAIEIWVSGLALVWVWSLSLGRGRAGMGRWMSGDWIVGVELRVVLIDALLRFGRIGSWG